jgi:hypothetical protein
MPIEKTTLSYGLNTRIVCPVCHNEHPKDVEDAPDFESFEAYAVNHKRGSAYCCSQKCAKAFEAHCDQPRETRKAYPIP